MANARQFKNVEIFPVALMERPDVINLYGDGDTASVNVGWFGAKSNFVQAVAANTLDNLFAGRWIGEKLLIKIDVENAEAGVLAGGKSLMRRLPAPIWIVESFSDDLGTLRDAGYDCTLIANGNYLCSRK